MTPRAVLLTAIALSGCTPQLGDAPFSCSGDGACPEGYSCKATVCERDGFTPPDQRPMRVTWINSAEMYWFTSASGGAVLVVNDGFTPGHRGLYEIIVDPSGTPTAPRQLAKYGEEFPTSSSVGLLDDGRYAVATLRFPPVDEDQITLTVSGIDREAAAGRTPGSETLYSEKQPYLGGSEPAYISALVRGKSMDVAWTRPAGGGVVGITHLEQNGSVWKAARTTTVPLPDGVLPLSGDCLLWQNGDGLTLRVGFESFAVAQLDKDGNATDFVPQDDLPIYAWGDQLLQLRYGDENTTTLAYPIQYALTTTEPKDIAVDDGGVLQEAIEPYTAVPYLDGAIFAPLSKDPAFSTLGVGFRSPTVGLRTIASIQRDSSDLLYSARPYVSGGHVYLAWTSFHEALMDLWVASVPLASAPASATMSAAVRPTLVRSMPAPAGLRRPQRRRRP